VSHTVARPVSATCKEMMEDLDTLAQTLGLDFRDRSLLFQALVHRSYLNENPGTRLFANERLEFLGDAILDAVAAEFLFQRCPEKSEGELTLWRSALVRTETLATFATRLDLGRYLVMGHGEEADGGRTRTTILADAFEAVLGALYLDGGMEAVRAFLTPFLQRALEGYAGQLPIDYKSSLQIEVQGRAGITPQYRTAATWGPEHARTFQVEVWAGEYLLGRGEGLSKQAAQQEAARVALEQLPPGGGIRGGEELPAAPGGGPEGRGAPKSPRARRPAAADRPRRGGAPKSPRARQPAAAAQPEEAAQDKPRRAPKGTQARVRSRKSAKQRNGSTADGEGVG
jgi:ribonuclease-3